MSGGLCPPDSGRAQVVLRRHRPWGSSTYLLRVEYVSSWQTTPHTKEVDLESVPSILCHAAGEPFEPCPPWLPATTSGQKQDCRVVRAGRVLAAHQGWGMHWGDLHPTALRPCRCRQLLLPGQDCHLDCITERGRANDSLLFPPYSISNANTRC